MWRDGLNPKVYFPKVHFPKVYFLKMYFPKVYFPKGYFPKVYFSKVYLSKCIFTKCTQLACLLSFASLFFALPQPIIQKISIFLPLEFIMLSSTEQIKIIFLAPTVSLYMFTTESNSCKSTQLNMLSLSSVFVAEIYVFI